MIFIKKSGEDKLIATGVWVPLGTRLIDAIRKSLDEEGPAPIHLDSPKGRLIGAVTGYYAEGKLKGNVIDNMVLKFDEVYFDKKNK